MGNETYQCEMLDYKAQLDYSGDTNLAHKSPRHTNKILIATYPEYDVQKFIDLSQGEKVIVPGMTYICAVDRNANPEKQIYSSKANFGLTPLLTSVDNPLVALSVDLTQKKQPKTDLTQKKQPTYIGIVSEQNVDKLLTGEFSYKPGFGDRISQIKPFQFKQKKLADKLNIFNFPVYHESQTLSPERISDYLKAVNPGDKRENIQTIFALQNLLPAVLIRNFERNFSHPDFNKLNHPAFLRQLGLNARQLQFIQPREDALNLLEQYVLNEVEFATECGLYLDPDPRFQELSRERFGIYRQENTELNPNFNLNDFEKEINLDFVSFVTEYNPLTSTALMRTIAYYQNNPILVSDGKVIAAPLYNSNLIQFALETERSLDDLVEFKEKVLP